MRADGTRTQARFEVVSLAEVPDTGVRIFVCSQPTREAVWLPELMSHANTAQAISRLTFACADPEASARQWRRVIPALGVQEMADGLTLTAGRHRIDLIGHEAARARFGIEPAAGQTRAIGIDYTVASLEACRATLAGNGVVHSRTDGSLRVAPDAACNVCIGFEEP